MIKYNKLVRDNIPKIISEAGKTCKTSFLDDKEYIEKLKEKLIEESCEVKNVNEEEIASELADVLEVVEAIETYYSLNHKKIVEYKIKKANKNGKFEKRILLEEVSEND